MKKPEEEFMEELDQGTLRPLPPGIEPSGSPGQRSNEKLISQLSICLFKTSTWLPSEWHPYTSLGAQVQIVGIEEKLNIALTSAGIFLNYLCGGLEPSRNRVVVPARQAT